MTLFSKLLLIVSLLFLAAAILTAVVQLFNGGWRAIHTRPVAALFGLYVVTYVAWLLL